MNIFGKEIQIKKLGCNVMGESGKPIPPSVNLFVKVTKGCNASCLFCSNANSPNSKGKFNVDKFLKSFMKFSKKTYS